MPSLFTDARRLTHYRGRTGELIDTAIQKMLNRSRLTGLRVSSVFNDIQIIVTPEMTEEEAIQQWETARRKQSSPFHQALNRRAIAADRLEVEERESKADKLLENGKMEIRWRKRAAYRKACAAQKSDMSRALLKFTQAWAIAMQNEIRLGHKPADVMRRLELDLDFVGLSGASWALAVSFLKEFWKYGDQLPAK